LSLKVDGNTSFTSKSSSSELLFVVAPVRWFGWAVDGEAVVDLPENSTFLAFGFQRTAEYINIERKMAVIL
jgi:hypothetical protein